MKYKTNIPALLFAILILISTNGIVIFEHICHTKNTHEFSILSDKHCELEKEASSCCKKDKIKKKDCCKHKQIFSKLLYDGFTAKKTAIQSYQKDIKLFCYTLNNIHFNNYNLDGYYSDLPPPYSIHYQHYLVKPSPIALMTFRC